MTKKKGDKPMQSIAQNDLSPLQKEILKKWQSKKQVGIPQSVKDELQIRFKGEVSFNEPMSKHTYIKIGGPAEVFLQPENKEALLYAVDLAKENIIPYYFHGSGANTLVRDGGVRGMVISVYNCLNEYKILEQTDEYLDVYAESGLGFNKLVHITKDLGFADLVPLTGIPGSLGGLVKMNAGTQVREMKDVIREITVLRDGVEVTLSREKLDFEYRNLKLPKTQAILAATLRLTDKQPPEQIVEDLKRYQKRRSDTQPLDYPNLGSVFRNPQAGHRNEIVATAGKLVDESGLKNVRVGGARISPKHANFIINEGDATAKDVLALIYLMKDKVKQTSGIVLETEIKVIGEE
jgi:UDP-N-acetylmuramate dehydrogenase